MGGLINPDGYDAGKMIKGKKRHFLVDTTGLMLPVLMHSAGSQDRDDGAIIMATLFGLFPFISKLFADAGYQGPVFRHRATTAMPGLDVRSAQPVPPTGQGLGVPQPDTAGVSVAGIDSADREKVRQGLRMIPYRLIELPVTIAISGLLRVLLAQDGHYGVINLGRRQHDGDRQSELETMDQMLRKLVSAMDPVGPSSDSAQVAGNANGFRLTAELPEGPRGFTPVRRTHILIEGDGARRLALSLQPPFPSPIGPAGAAQHAILLEGEEGVNVAYWRTAGANQPAARRTIWSSRDLPELFQFGSYLPTRPANLNQHIGPKLSSRP